MEKKVMNDSLAKWTLEDWKDSAVGQVDEVESELLYALEEYVADSARMITRLCPASTSQIKKAVIAGVDKYAASEKNGRKLARRQASGQTI